VCVVDAIRRFARPANSPKWLDNWFGVYAALVCAFSLALSVSLAVVMFPQWMSFLIR
jgi:hypothetical protein